MKLLKQSLGNETGAMTLLVVVMTSICMITLLSTTYIYTVNRAKYHARIKQAYALQNVMEEAAKRMRQFYDSDPAHGGWPTSDECSLGGAASLKVTGPDGKTYCFGLNKTINPTGGTMYALEGTMKLEGESSLPSQLSYVQKFVARLDSFFDETKFRSIERREDDPRTYFNKPTMVGWLFKPSDALAGAANYDFVGSLSHSPDSNNPTRVTVLAGEGRDDGGGTRQSPTPYVPPGGGACTGTNACSGGSTNCFGAPLHAGGSPCSETCGETMDFRNITQASECRQYASVSLILGSPGGICQSGMNGYEACIAVCEPNATTGICHGGGTLPSPSPTPIQVDPNGWNTGMTSCGALPPPSSCTGGGASSPSCRNGCVVCTTGRCASISLTMVNAQGDVVIDSSGAAWRSSQAFKFVQPGDFRSR